YPGFSMSLSRFFLILIPPFLRRYPGFSLPLSRFFLVLIPLFPAAKPRLDSEGCPGQQNWTEGQEGILACKAKGKPKPEVKCSKDGNSITAGTPYPADRAQAGTYRCRATNALGTAERDVTVWVQC
ncbi:ICAM1 protein, partial [Corvus moneduloides]|nr:ICAM1 protein [Corvus moneduloides]